MSNTLKQALEKRGLTVNEASKKGISYFSIYAQYVGRRSVGYRCALEYERKLGIPRSELRPDIWPPDASQPSTDAEAQEYCDDAEH